MAMFDCTHCGDRHHVDDLCATGPMSLQPTAPRTAPMPETMSPREKVAEQTIGPVNYDRLRSVIHSATHAALPFAEAPMTIPFSTQERAALQAEIADLIISNLDKATVPITALAALQAEQKGRA